MSEKEISSKDIEKVLSANPNLMQKITRKIGVESNTTYINILMNISLNYKEKPALLDKKTIKMICDFISYKGEKSKLETILKNLNEHIENRLQSNKFEIYGKTAAEDICLAALQVKLDILDRANTNGKYNNLIKDTTDCTETYLIQMFDKYEEIDKDKDPKDRKNAWERIQEGIYGGYPVIMQFADKAVQGQTDPSMNFAKAIIKVHEEKTGKFPEIRLFGNAACAFIRSGNLEFAKKATDFESLYNLSSSQDEVDKQKMKESSEETFNSALFKKEFYFVLSRENPNLLADLFRSFMISNFNVETDELGVYKNINEFNEFFFDTIDKIFNKQIVENKNNLEVIKKINYMFNCPVSIKSAKTIGGDKITTIADCTNYILSKKEVMLDKGLITEEQYSILENFAKLTSITPDEELNIPNFKLMDYNENKAKYGAKDVDRIITIKGIDDDFLKSLTPKELNIESNTVENNINRENTQNILTEEDIRQAMNKFNEYVTNLIKFKELEKIVFTLQVYKKNKNKDVGPMLKKLQKTNRFNKEETKIIKKSLDMYRKSKKSRTQIQKDRRFIESQPISV